MLGEPRPLFAAAEAAGDPIAVLPTLYHLMWHKAIVADLGSAPLGPETVVGLAGDGKQ